MKLKLLAPVAALAFVVACESTPDQTGAATGAGQATGPRAGSQEDLVANIGDRVFFDFDRFNIRGDQRPTLERQAAWLGQHGAVNVQIAGHADERGTREYNLALGQRRADSARDTLVALGVAPARISTISFGKDRPIALGSNEEAWAQNRVAITSVR
ncbi:peptidoglycan-associated lipoprotein Pal [Elioraea sp.]|uniref:peptidoglycan-associated lipoprotein Pal n=1 Tax=Elioraea sp. TaxID=2185103 RepID=UPI003F71F8E5